MRSLHPVISARFITACTFFLLAGHTVRAQTPAVLKISFSIDSIARSPVSDTIFYPHRPLQYDDFLPRTSGGGRNAAVSFTSFSYEGSSRRYKDTLEIRLLLQVFFVKSASWMRPDARNSYTLAHEQLHFDITWLVAMRFRQKILEASFTLDDYDSIIQYEYLASFREMNVRQEQFDRETRNGLDPVAQRQWELLIRQGKLPDE